MTNEQERELQEIISSFQVRFPEEDEVEQAEEKLYNLIARIEGSK